MSSPLLKEIGMANGFDNSQDRAEISGILPNHQDDEDIDNDDKIYTTNLEYQLRQKSRRLRQDRQPQKLPSPGGPARPKKSTKYSGSVFSKRPTSKKDSIGSNTLSNEDYYNGSP
tara:strand:+ start:1394 stop:1738 length:345 start_codon:yes stop_codon:yes gene_type:complete